MVSRPRLALITLFLVLLSFVACILSAQEIPLLQGPAFVIPPSWQITYDPPQIAVRLAIAPDSTLSLINILGSQQELRPLVQQYLTDNGVALLGSNAFPIPGLEDVILPITKITPLQAPEENEQDLRAAVENWVVAQRKSKAADVIWGFNAVAPGSSPLLYRSGYSSIGLDRADTDIRLDGSRLPASIVSGAVSHGYFQAFYEPAALPAGQNYLDISYPYPVAVTDLQAGMGDYEHRFARIALKKNALLGVEGSYYAFDLLVAHGWWAQANTAQTSMRHRLTLPIGPADLTLEYADFAQDISMAQLRPVYWQSSIFTVDHALRKLTARIRSPYLDVSAAWLREQASSFAFGIDPKQKATLLRAEKEFTMGNLGIGAAYEHAERDANAEIATGSAVPLYDDLVEARISYRSGRLEALFGGGLYDWENPFVNAMLHAELGKLSLGARLRSDLYDLPSNTSFTDVFTGMGYLSGADIRYPGEYAALVGLQPIPGIKASLAVGRRKIQNYLPAVGGDTLIEAEPLFAGLNASLSIPLGNYSLDWLQDLSWTQMQYGLRESPQWTTRGDICFTRHLAWDNALFAGLSYTGHTDYTSSNASAFGVDASTIWDARVGVRISKLFEISIAYRNITDSSIFGAYPVPASLHASLRWFYLN